MIPKVPILIWGRVNLIRTCAIVTITLQKTSLMCKSQGNGQIFPSQVLCTSCNISPWQVEPQIILSSAERGGLGGEVDT